MPTVMLKVPSISPLLLKMDEPDEPGAVAGQEYCMKAVSMPRN